MNEGQKLTLEERMFALEERVEYMNELLEENAKSFEQLMVALNKLMESKNRENQDIAEWAEKVEERLGKLMVQQVNLSLVVDETIKITPEQMNRIQKRVEDIKKQHAKENNPKNNGKKERK